MNQNIMKMIYLTVALIAAGGCADGRGFKVWTAGGCAIGKLFGYAAGGN